MNSSRYFDQSGSDAGLASVIARVAAAAVRHAREVWRFLETAEPKRDPRFQILWTEPT